MFLVIVILFICKSVFAAPTVNAFSASSKSLISGQIMSLSWLGEETSGYNLLVSCQLGIKVKNQDGTVFPCDSKVSTTNQSSDSITFFIINNSGSSKSVGFKLYPKSINGDEYSSAVASEVVSVSPNPVPLLGLYSSATTTQTASSTLLTWSSSDLDGVNLILSCVDGLVATSSVDNNIIPCGKVAFDNKLPASGSITLLFKNNNVDRKFVDVLLLPYIGNGLYDMTHSLKITLDVASDKNTSPELLSFITSKPVISSDDNLDILWKSKYTSGVNLKISCNESIRAFLVSSSSSQTIKCGSLVFDNALDPNSSTTLSFYNSSTEKQSVFITLLPEVSKGSFSGINTKTVVLEVLPKGQVPTYIDPTVKISSSTNLKISDTKTSSNKSISPRKKFMKSLKIGSKGDDVSALQEYLLKAGYNIESVTGYFGKQTQKAVEKFQEDNGIAKKGSAGYGTVGPATRLKLNSF